MTGSFLIGFLGAVMVLIINYDATRTIFSASTAGPITNRLLSLTWSALLHYHHKRPNHGLLAAAGPWSAFILVIFWLAIAWLGWFLLFCSSEQAVVNSTTQQAATVIERAYYTGYTLTTLGYGDFVPGDDDWRIPPFLAAANGFYLFTLTITYFLNVVSAVIQKRQLALAISALGQTPYEIIQATAGDGKYETLASQAQQFQQSINMIGQQHLAFPVLHYFHNVYSDNALPLALTRLYQTLAILCHANPTLPASTREQLLITQNTIKQFLGTLGSAYIQPAKKAPAIPDLSDIAERDDINKTGDELEEYLYSLSEQKILVSYIVRDGWQWQEVWKPLNRPSLLGDLS